MSIAVKNAIDGLAAGSGITTTYVDFTTKLVTDVMHALVSSSISQMRAYVDLVAQLERGLAAFKAPATSASAIIQWLESRIPELGSDLTKLSLPGSALSENSIDIVKNLYQSRLVTTLGPPTWLLPGLTNLDTLATTTLTAAQIETQTGTGTGTTLDASNAVEYSSLVGATPPPTTHQIELVSAVKTVLADDATNSYQQLDLLVQRGLLRIVVTDGHLLTKMSFSMGTSEASQQNSQDIYSSAFAVSGSAGVSWRWLSASIKSSYSTFNVQLADAHSQTSTEIFTTMMGEVLVNFKSDFFPSLPSQAKP